MGNIVVQSQRQSRICHLNSFMFANMNVSFMFTVQSQSHSPLFASLVGFKFRCLSLPSFHFHSLPSPTFLTLSLSHFLPMSATCISSAFAVLMKLAAVILWLFIALRRHADCRFDRTLLSRQHHLSAVFCGSGVFWQVYIVLLQLNWSSQRLPPILFIIKWLLFY